MAIGTNVRSNLNFLMYLDLYQGDTTGIEISP